MSASTTTPPDHPVDPDMAQQANPGFGIPSQDPRPGAQAPLLPDEAKREARSVLVGGAAMAGAATGATLGVVVGGPAGVLVGAAVGAVVGAVGGEAAGGLVAPDPPPAVAHG